MVFLGTRRGRRIQNPSLCLTGPKVLGILKRYEDNCPRQKLVEGRGTELIVGGGPSVMFTCCREIGLGALLGLRAFLSQARRKTKQIRLEGLSQSKSKLAFDHLFNRSVS